MNTLAAVVVDVMWRVLDEEGAELVEDNDHRVGHLLSVQVHHTDQSVHEAVLFRFVLLCTVSCRSDDLKEGT